MRKYGGCKSDRGMRHTCARLSILRTPMLELPDADSYQRAVGEKLRQLRRAAGLSCRQVGESAAMSEAKVSRIETGLLPVRSDDLIALLDAIDCSTSDREGVLGLARNTVTLDVSPDLFVVTANRVRHPQEHHADLERSCQKFESFSLMIPGMLQTAEYARSVLRPALAQDVTEAAMARLARQRRLFDESKTFTFLISESALRFEVVASAAMRAQLSHLVAISTLVNLRIGVVPFVAHAVAPQLAPFILYDRELACFDSAIGTIGSSSRVDVDNLVKWFERLSDVALWGDEFRSFVQSSHLFTSSD